MESQNQERSSQNSYSRRGSNSHISMSDTDSLASQLDSFHSPLPSPSPSPSPSPPTTNLTKAIILHSPHTPSPDHLSFPPTPGTPPPVAPPPPPTRQGAAAAAEMVYSYNKVGGVRGGVRMVEEEKVVGGVGGRVSGVRMAGRREDEQRGVGGRVAGVRKGGRNNEDVGGGDWEEEEDKGVGTGGKVGGVKKVERRNEDVGVGDWEEEGGRGERKYRVGRDLEEERGEGARGVGSKNKYRLGRDGGVGSEGGVGVLRRKKREGNMKMLGFRICEMVVCVVSFSIMAKDKTQGWAGDSYDRYKEYRYCLAVNVIGFVHASFQAFDLACNLASGKHILSSLHYHFEFLMDQILAYLLMSASSSAATRVDDWVSNWGKDTFTQMATASVAMSFVAFFAFAISSLISGYNLCNRDSS